MPRMDSKGVQSLTSTKKALGLEQAGSDKSPKAKRPSAEAQRAVLVPGHVDQAHFDLLMSFTNIRPGKISEGLRGFFVGGAQQKDLVATVGVTVPSYVIATLFVYVFALKLGVVTVGFWEGLPTAILPAITLAGYPLAFISRLTRSSMLEVIQQDYVRTARSKGLRERTVIYVHALRNALIPIMTYLGPLTAAILTGSFVVEQIFGVPGLGTFFVTSIQNRDYTTIMGVTVFYSALLVGLNLVVDLGYALVDPRIKFD